MGSEKEGLLLKTEAFPLENTGSVMPPSIKRLLEVDIGKLDSGQLVNLTGEVVDNLALTGVETSQALLLLEEARGTPELNKDLRLGLQALLEAERNMERLIYDRITGLAKEDPLRQGLVEGIKTRIDVEGRLPPVYCLHLDIDELHDLNRKYGREEVNRGFGRLATYVVKEINEHANQLPEDCLVYAFRKGETGDEILIFFVGLSHNQAEELNVLVAPEWPEVRLKGKDVQITASVSRVHSDELKEILSPEDIDKIGPMLKTLDDVTEERINQLKGQQQIGR